MLGFPNSKFELSETVTVSVVKVSSEPYAVPPEFVAYALKWYVVEEVSPVTLHVKESVPVPLVTLESEMVGLAVILQHTPRYVTDAPPLDKTFPPHVADMEVIEVALVVLTLASSAVVVKTMSFPYIVPTEFVA